MKWFHHECSARHDPKLQMLGAAHGAEGLGIYWSLLEELGQHSDLFRLRIIGRTSEEEEHLTRHIPSTNQQFLPVLPMKILARNLFTSIRKLREVIDTCVLIGLFDVSLWQSEGILHSPAFEHRADDYTRRVKKVSGLPRTKHTQSGNGKSQDTPDKLRTNSEHSSVKLRTMHALSGVEGSEQSTNNVRTNSVLASNNVRVDTDTEEEGEEEQKKNRRRREEKMLIKKTPAVDNSKSPNADENQYLIEPADEDFEDYSLKFCQILQKWDHECPGHLINWTPSNSELRKLFFGGKYEQKLTMCFHAYKLLGEKINFPELVLRALNLMLHTHVKSQIDNPLGWLWTCLHGSGRGTRPWAQLLTADEENHPTKRGEQ